MDSGQLVNLVIGGVTGIALAIIAFMFGMVASDRSDAKRRKDLERELVARGLGEYITDGDDIIFKIK